MGDCPKIRKGSDRVNKMSKEEEFERFVARYRRKRHFGWGVIRGIIAIVVSVGIFYGCMWVTDRQEGLMPGGSIPGEIKHEILWGD